MDVDKFNQNFMTTIVRYEIYPASEPTSYVVGFNVVHNNNKLSYYIDTLVDINCSKCEKQICKLAWEKVKDIVFSWCEEACTKRSLLNSVFVPE